MRTTEDTWILSFYRASEMAGATFFGRLGRLVPAGPIQRDMTKHFADEAQHAWYWTECMDQLGLRPCDIRGAYQDQYLQAAGIPTNIMEALAITQVFEKRVVRQYAQHERLGDTHPLVRQTLRRIMEDESWHLAWIRDALRGLTPEYGADTIAGTLRRYTAADREVYARVTEEHADCLQHLLAGRATPTPQRKE